MFERMPIHFLWKSDVLTAVAAVVPWTWGIDAWLEKILLVTVLDPYRLHQNGLAPWGGGLIFYALAGPVKRIPSRNPA